MILFIFIFGLFLGSFLLVVASRLPKGESFWKGRSRCEYCNHILEAKDLVPIFSFLLLKGKCRYCSEKLSFKYPFAEVLTGLVFITPFFTQNINLISWNQDQIFSVIFIIFILSVLIVIFFADIEYYIIPFQVLLPAIVVVCIWDILVRPENFMNYLISGTGALLFFLAIFLISKGRGMGFGDVVLVFFMGILLGFPNIIVALYVAFLTGAVVSLILVLSRKKKLRGGVIPFGPFLIFGTYVALFWGDKLASLAWSYIYL